MTKRIQCLLVFILKRLTPHTRVLTLHPAQPDSRKSGRHEAVLDGSGDHLLPWSDEND